MKGLSNEVPGQIENVPNRACGCAGVTFACRPGGASRVGRVVSVCLALVGILAACGDPREEFAKAETANTEQAYREFADRYPNSELGNLARRRSTDSQFLVEQSRAVGEAVIRMAPAVEVRSGTVFSLGQGGIFTGTFQSTGETVEKITGFESNETPANLARLRMALEEGGNPDLVSVSGFKRPKQVGNSVDRGSDGKIEADKVEGSMTLYEYCAENKLADALALLEERKTGTFDLAAAARKRDIAKTRELLDKAGADAGKSGAARGAMTVAIRNGDRQIISLLLDRGADVNAFDLQGRTPLMLAGIYGDMEIVRLLLNKGARLDLAVTGRETVLSAAAAGGSPEIVRLLLSKGVDPNNRSAWEGPTPLISAAREGHLEVCKLLLENGAKSDPENKSLTAYGWAARNGHVDVVKLLAPKEVRANAKDTHKESCSDEAVMEAAKGGHVEIVKFLLAQGTAFEGEGCKEGSPLAYAVQNGHADIVRLLADKGANVNQMTVVGVESVQSTLYSFHHERIPIPVLVLAVKKEFAPVVEVLLDKGANMETKDGHDALYEAVLWNRKDDVAKLLIARGANVKAKNCEALDMAAAHGQLEIVQLLLDKGADVNARSEYGKGTPLMSASLTGNVKIAEYLIARGAEVNAKNSHGETALVVAVQQKQFDVARLLLEKGADPDARTKAGIKALSLMPPTK